MSAQPRDVRIAAIKAIGAICVAALRRRTHPPLSIVESLAFLRMLAADHETGEGFQDGCATTRLDRYLQTKYGDASGDAQLARTHDS